METSDSTVRCVLSELVHGAVARSALRASALTESYLVGVLLDFLRSDPQRLGLLLGAEWLKATALPPLLRYRRVREIADTTLFLSGVFADYVDSSATGSDYYRSIGTRAYLDLGALAQNRGCSESPPSADIFADTYNDLGRRFQQFALVLSTIADRELFPAQRRVLALYQRWLERGSERHRRRLLSLGVTLEIPDPLRPN
ncbi:MAG: hypothetical protein HY899_03720 [Deltaproteobacteria bacterium]|nr:hypothetical protein [Deltaproteobacteria bacterium]